MTITTQSRSMCAASVENGVRAVGDFAWKALYGAFEANLSRGRDGWYGLADVHRIRTAPTLVA